MALHIHIPGLELGAELGQGAHSVVYRARQGSVPCAVKVPKARGSWTRWVYREAVALARVRDPGLPRVLEVGEASGLPYLVMELVEGETLADRLRRGPLPATAVLDIGERLLSILASVHDAGLIHRDVKPRNLVLEPGGQVRLVDFGFATPSERTAYAGEAAGTPAYAAPELLRAPARIDGRADLYGVGRVLLECLTGRLPPASDAVSAASDELAAAGVPVSLGGVVLGLLAPDPDARYPDARAALADLALAWQGGPVQGPGGHEPEGRAQPFVGREAELKRLLRAVAAAEAAGGVVLVEGARGSGKTRLLTAASRQWRGRPGALLAVHCREGDPPLAVTRRVLEAFHQRAGRRAPEGDDAVKSALRQAAEGPLASIATLIAPSLEGVVEAGAFEPGGAPGALAEGAAELLLRLARRRGPLVIVIDDLQWIDPASRDVLVRLAHRAREAPICLVLAARPALGQASALDRFRGVAAPDALVELPAFDDGRTAALMAVHLGVDRVEPAWVSRVAALSDGTPLGILEVLGAFLDVGALRPHAGAWTLDPDRAARVALPAGALALLGRRLVELPAAARRVLEIAAVAGTAFSDELLARAVGIPLGDLEFGLADARRAGLVQAAEPGEHRFVHDSLRELVAGGLAEPDRRRVHQLLAEAYDQLGSRELAALCATAEHYAAGELEVSPTRAHDAARAAATAALARFDNETAIRFLGLARAAAEVAGAPLDAGFFKSLGEAQLRLGALEESLRSFEAALAQVSGSRERAELLGRIAWVHQSNAQPELAWSSLEAAFVELEERMPSEGPGSALDTVGALLARGRRRSPGSPQTISTSESARRALLCSLHYQNARLGLEYNKPLRLLQSSIQALRESEPLGVCRAQAQSRALYGFVQIALGRNVAGSAQLAEARALAEAVGDPVAQAFCVQVGQVAACWVGDFKTALELSEECLGTRGHWLELNELCHDAANADLIEAFRGRPSAGWAWIQRAIDRVRRSERGSPAFTDLVVHRARACLASQGRGVSDPWLAAQIELALDPQRPRQGFCWLLSWGARVRVLTEAGDLGPAFEQLVREFEAEGHNPRTVHPVVAEYYVAVAHARVHQCLRAPRGERARHLANVRRALSDLKASARLPLFKAHRLLIEAYVAWWSGSPAQADKLLAGAERLAIPECAMWVQYGVARARAHMLKEVGNLDAARDQGRLAEALAAAHGAEVRARWIREELELPAPSLAPSVETRSTLTGSSDHVRKQLTALLQVVRAGTESLAPEEQAVAILDEIIRDVDADRACLWFQPDLGLSTHLMVARTREGETTFGADAAHDALLRQIREVGSVALSDVESAALELGHPADCPRVLGAPLSLHDRTLGAICVERSASAPAFRQEERDLLSVLASQVPTILEVGRLLAERERLQATLQQAQKMEAVGQLAGGVAHDFNNMIQATQSALDDIARRGGRAEGWAAELDIIRQATGRAAELTSKLLSFSRHKPVPLEPCDLNATIAGLEPMLRRLLGEEVKLHVELERALCTVNTDRAGFEQAIVNLALNARDAMSGGGTLTIATANVELDESARVRGATSVGEHVMVLVADSGHGMTEEHIGRVFEPFFTTKPPGKGTGLGLAMVYAFVKNSGGHIEISSEVGRGTTFCLYLPRAQAVAVVAHEPARPAPKSAPARRQRPPGAGTILVVDDEELVAKSIRRMLESGGYEVLVAHDAGQAFALADERGPDISLVILDMIMPDISGSELGRQFHDRKLPAKLLYVSGYSPETAQIPGLGFDPDGFLEKPFSMSDLLGQVRRILDS